MYIYIYISYIYIIYHIYHIYIYIIYILYPTKKSVQKISYFITIIPLYKTRHPLGSSLNQGGCGPKLRMAKL